MKLFLFINTVSSNQISIGLFNKNGLIDEVVYQSINNRSREALNLLDKLLKKNEVELKSLKGIAVVIGPGSFTGIRLGLAVANTLAFFLKIPIIGITSDKVQKTNNLIKEVAKQFLRTKKQYFVLPFYGKKPNITRSKK